MRATSGRISAIGEDLIGKMRRREEIDLVGDFAYPLPVAIICELLGIPSGDEQKFESWSATLAGVLDPDQWVREEDRLKSIENYDAITHYLSAIIKAKRKQPTTFCRALRPTRTKNLGEWANMISSPQPSFC